MFLRKPRWISLSAAGAICGCLVALPSSAIAFDDKDCGHLETVSQTYTLELKATDSVDSARARATGELVKQAIAQVIGYEIHSDREQNTSVSNDAAQEKYQDAEKALLNGLARVKITDEKRTALPSGQSVALSADVTVCVPKPEATAKAEKERDERALHPPKIVDPTTAVWFNPTSGQPQIWYSRKDNGMYSFFDNAGYDPESGEALHPISPKILHDWKLSLARKQREEASQLEASKRAAEQDAANRERDRMAAEKHADLVSHARENCDKLAANPNDPEKPKSIIGTTFDDMRASTDQAIEACQAASQIEPADRRLRYQLARAISVNDPKKAMPLFKALCGERYPAAFDNYGWAFVDRRTGLHNLEASIAFFRKGAQLGDSDAMVSLASYIQRGKVPGSGTNEAVELYQRAASLGNDDAIKALEPLMAAQRQAEQQKQQDLQNTQAVIGLFSGIVGGIRR